MSMSHLKYTDLLRLVKATLPGVASVTGRATESRMVILHLTDMNEC